MHGGELGSRPSQEMTGRGAISATVASPMRHEHDAGAARLNRLDHAGALEESRQCERLIGVEYSADALSRQLRGVEHQLHFVVTIEFLYDLDQRVAIEDQPTAAPRSHRGRIGHARCMDLLVVGDIRTRAGSDVYGEIR